MLSFNSITDLHLLQSLLDYTLHIFYLLKSSYSADSYCFSKLSSLVFSPEPKQTSLINVRTNRKTNRNKPVMRVQLYVFLACGQQVGFPGTCTHTHTLDPTGHHPKRGTLHRSVWQTERWGFSTQIQWINKKMTAN